MDREEKKFKIKWFMKSLSIKQNNVSTGMGNTVSSFNYIFNPLTFKVVKLNLKIWILIFIFYKRSGPAG